MVVSRIWLGGIAGRPTVPHVLDDTRAGGVQVKVKVARAVMATCEGVVTVARTKKPLAPQWSWVKACKDGRMSEVQ